MNDLWTETGKNRLERFCHFRRLRQGSVMNALQERGLISDNCVDVADVAEADTQRAIDFLLDDLAEHPKRFA